MQEEGRSPSAGISGWWERKTGETLRTRDKVVGILVLVIFLFVFYVVLDANKYPALVRAVEGEGTVGVNPTDQALDFGDLSRGTSAVRRVDIQNDTPIPMFIMTFKTGDIASLIDINKNFFRLEPRGGEKLSFTLYMPASAEIDQTYKGRVYLFKVPTF